MLRADRMVPTPPNPTAPVGRMELVLVGPTVRVGRMVPVLVGPTARVDRRRMARPARRHSVLAGRTVRLPVVRASPPL
ncbi:MAG: hypothetical protein IRZ07_25780 [Microbispora sp.]|nr:hypothetical protein [Microbispora sp.]